MVAVEAAVVAEVAAVEARKEEGEEDGLLDLLVDLGEAGKDRDKEEDLQVAYWRDKLQSARAAKQKIAEQLLDQEGGERGDEEREDGRGGKGKGKEAGGGGKGKGKEVEGETRVPDFVTESEVAMEMIRILSAQGAMSEESG
jgi:hypothetical protein